MMHMGIPKPRMIRATMYMAAIGRIVVRTCAHDLGMEAIPTVLRETLEESTKALDRGADEDGPATTEPLVDHGGDGEREDGTESVSSRNDALELRAEGLAWAAEVCISRVSKRET